ncbi:hypothetical protein BG005_000136 [Podila minutissima]|nr:hypothetical protein BG005_000136 [Podila minutissima]
MFSHTRTTYNLPEVEIVVFELLTRHDLAQCATVCKSWHAMVVPLIWRKIPELSPTQQACFRQIILEDYNQHVILQKLPLLDQHLFACEETMCRLDEAWEQLWQQAVQSENHGILDRMLSLRTKLRRAEANKGQIQENQRLLPPTALMRYSRWIGRLDRRPLACEQTMRDLDEAWDQLFQQAIQQENKQPLLRGINSLRAGLQQVDADHGRIQEKPLRPLLLPPTALMKYGHWICGTPEIRHFLQTLQLPHNHNSLQRQNPYLASSWPSKYDLLRHFLERVPSAQYRLLGKQDYLWHDSFLHDLVRLVVPTLTELNFANGEVDILDLRQILAAAKGLTHLHVDICRIIYDEEGSVVPKIDDIHQFRAGLTTLTISTEDEDIPIEFWAGFWRDCPNVVSLHVGNVVPGLVEMLKKDVPVHLPRLNCLRMVRGSPPDSYEYDISDEDIAALLMANTEGWTVVETCPRAQLGPLGWSALSRHYSTLQELVLVQSSSSQILVDILASCPNLRILDTLGANNYDRWPDLETRAVHAEHFIDGDKDETDNTFRPWACEATLQRLTVGITGIEMSDQGEFSELRARLYGRLARFTRLEVLMLKSRQKDISNKFPLYLH